MAGNSGDESVPNETCVTNDTQQEQQVSESHTNVFITPEGDIKYLCSVCGQCFYKKQNIFVSHKLMYLD